MTLLAVALFVLVWRYLPETNLHLKKRALQPARLWTNYRRILVMPEFVFNAVLGGCCAALATVAMSLLHMNTIDDIPLVFLILTGIAIGLFVGYCVMYGPRGAAQGRRRVADAAA